MTVLVVVRHGRTVPDPSTPAANWPLAEQRLPDGFAETIGPCETWLCSPELKARQTAELLTDRPIRIDERLREVGRGGHLDDYDTAVRRHLTKLDRPAADGWETGREARTRLAAFVHEVTDKGAPRMVAVTHGLVMAHLHALLTGGTADLDWWRDLDMPDVRTYELSERGTGHQEPR